jgi:cytochrome c-type biogenesis protein CcmH/NrfG
MNEEGNQEILAELRELKKASRRVLYLVMILVVVAVLSFPIPRRFRSSSQEISWTEVDVAMRRQDFREALAEAQALAKRQPDYYYGHAYLGVIYLAMNDVTNAEAQYSLAYDLFPTDVGFKELVAARKRLTSTKPFLLK